MSLRYLTLLILPSFFFIQGSIAQNQDCFNALPICEYGTYHFDNIEGFGEEQTLERPFDCFNGRFKETNSMWLRFQIQERGTIVFTIDPLIDADDLDFILFEQDQTCNSLTPIRCMGSGETIGVKNKSANLPCRGSTGLKLNSVDEFESTGCKYTDDNFLRFLQAEKGEDYILMVNNYNSTSGFSLTFEGSAILDEIENCNKITNVLNQDLSITEIFPNPASSEIRLDFLSKSTDLVVVEILDFSGRIFQSYTMSPISGLNKETYNVSLLPSGSYLFRINQVGYSATKQFIKQ